MIARKQDYLSAFLIALPLFSLFLGLMAWLRYGLDLPWFDDWRGYADGTIRSLDPRYLFRPINDTMAPVGFALDALAQRYLDGNSIAYQFLSMAAVLGGLLWLQWKLLLRTLENRLLASLCFAFAIFMLQPDSYWGRENLAYHQCLPLIFILAAVWIMVCSEVARWWHGPVLFGLGLLAGFTYISGAFGAFTAGFALLCVARLCYRDEPRRRLFRHALWFTAAGGFAAVVQYVTAVLPMRGTHAGIPMSLPHEAQFWAFFMGKLGRSLLLPQGAPGLSLALTLLVCATSVAAAGALVLRAARRGSSEQDRRIAAIFVTVGAVVFVYMVMVAVGRTRFRPAEVVALLDVFAYGFTRFHFFWATLLWPWLAAALILLARPRLHATSMRWVAGALVLVLFLGTVMSNGFDHMAQHRRLSQERTPIARCLLDELQREGPIECVGLIPPRFEVVAPDAYGAYAYAWNTGASFVRQFPILPGAERAEKIPPFYQLNQRIGKIDLEEMEYLGGREVTVTGSDPKLFLHTGQQEILESCVDLAVQVDIKAAVDGPATLYVLPRRMTAFSENHAQQTEVRAASGLQTLHFRLRHPEGFTHPLRFDPAVKPQKLTIEDVRVYCLDRRRKH